MKILVDTRSFFHSNINSGTIQFLNKLFSHLQQTIDGLEFVLLTDKFSKQFVKNTSSHSILTINSLHGKLGWKIWFDFQIPQAAKKNKIDLFISNCITSSSLKIPQCIFLFNDAENNYSTKTKSFFSFYKARKKTSFVKAKSIFVFSEYAKQNISQQEKVDPAKIHVLHSAANENYKPLLWTEKENVKIKFAGGKEYFAVMGIEKTEGIITILKAFSQFKKRQQSNMQLLIMGENTAGNFELTEKLESFKYRTDVHLHDSDDEKNVCSIISASYALIYYSDENEPAIEIANACMANVPVITSKTNSLIELFEDSIVYSDISNYDLLSADMITMYKDENFRKQLIEKEKMKSAQFGLQQTCNELWYGFLQATNNKE